MRGAAFAQRAPELQAGTRRIHDNNATPSSLSEATEQSSNRLFRKKIASRSFIIGRAFAQRVGP